MRIRPLTRRGRMIVSNASHNTTASNTTPITPLNTRTSPPRLGRHVGRWLERLEVRHHLPDRAGGKQAAVRGHAVRLAGIDGLEDLIVGAAVAPASVPQARPPPPRRAPAMAPVAIHRHERPHSFRGRRPVALEGILARDGRGP